MSDGNLHRENQELRRCLEEAESALAAIRQGTVDTIVVEAPEGVRAYCLSGTETVYRVAIETMAEAVIDVAPDGTILFCNTRFTQITDTPSEHLIGRELTSFVRTEDQDRLCALLQQCLRAPVSDRIVFRGSNGDRTPAWVTGRALERAHGMSLCLIALDLTELESSDHQITQLRQTQQALKEARRQAEQAAEALRLSEERLELAFRATQDGVWDWNLETDEVFYSSRWKSMLGYGDAEIENQTSAWKRLLHPDDFPRCAEAVEKVLRGEQDFVIEFRMRHKDGHYVPILSRGHTVRPRPGAPVTRIVGTHFDLSERKQSEAALQASEERFRQMASAVSEVFWMATPAMDQVLYVSPAVEELWGHPVEAIVADPLLWVKAIHPEDRPRMQEALQGPVLAGSHEMEFRVERPDGSIRWIHGRSYPVRDAEGQVSVITGVCSDITARRQMEKQLQASEEQKFRAIFDGASDGILVADIESKKIVLANFRICQMLGYTQEEIMELGVQDIHPHIPPDQSQQAFEQAARGIALPLLDFELRRKDGTRLPVNVAPGFVDADGKSLVVGFFRDISERKQAEAALAESEARYRLLLETLPLSVMVIDLSYRIILANQSAARLFGAAHAEDLAGRSIWDLTQNDPQDPAMSARLAELWAQGEVAPVERLFRTLDGSIIPIETRAVALKSLDGEMTGFMLVGENITARKQAEEGLRQSEFKYRVVAENTFDWEFWLSPEGHYLYTSPSCERITGYSPAEFTADPLLMERIIHPEDLASYQAHRSLAPTEQHQREMEFRVIRRDGVVRWIGHICGSIRERDGRVHGVRGSNRDITERKHAEMALRESEARYRLLMENMPLAVMDTSYQIVMANQAAASLARLASARDLVGRSAFEFSRVPVDDPAMAARIAELLAHGEAPPFEAQFTAQDGSTFPVETRAIALKDAAGKAQGFLGLAEDITSRKRAAAETAARESIWRIFLETDSPERIYARLAADLVAQLGFPIASVELYDSERDEMVFVGTAGMSDILAGLRIPADQTLSSIPVKTGQPVSENQISRISAEIYAPLRRFEVETFICVPFSAGKQGKGILAVADRAVRTDAEAWVQNLQGIAQTLSLEISRRNAVEALFESEIRFRALIEAAPEGVLVQSDGRCLYANQALADLLGAGHSADLLNRNPFELVAPEFHDLVRERIRRQCETGDSVPPVELEYVRFDGTRVPVESTAVPCRFEGQTAHLVFLRDITARRQAEADRAQLEAQLRQAQKLEAVGQLAGGVAHDFNNLLQVIVMNTELARQECRAGSAGAEHLKEVRDAAARATDLTRQLLAFGRRQVIHPVELDLNEVVHGVLKMLRRLLGEHIELQFHSLGSLGTVLVDKGQLEQIIMNLCINARDSMPRGGSLALHTENVSFGQADCLRYPWAKAGDFAVLTVTDTGEGMDAATLERLFEPFFTTKELGKGTGLGLATVYGIVQQNKGLIHVSSEPGMGTEFKVYFPTMQGRAAKPPAEAKRMVTGGSETILIAEDDDIILPMLASVLRNAGYTVLTAANGMEALRLYEQNAASVHLVMLDVMMPGMSGKEVMDRIVARGFQVPFLFSSGYSQDAIHTDFVIHEGLHLIQKPYDPGTLLLNVRKAIDSAKPQEGPPPAP